VDRLIYRQLSESGATAALRDIISDYEISNFEAALDAIAMDGIDSNALLAGAQHAFAFVGLNQGFTGVAGQFDATQMGNAVTGAITLVQADVNGDKKRTSRSS
jgi:hypothetical protein